MDASRRGDDRGKEGVTQGVGRVAIPIFLRRKDGFNVSMRAAKTMKVDDVP